MGAAGTVSTFIIDVCTNRLNLDLTTPEAAMVVLLSSLAVGYLIPERTNKLQPSADQPPVTVVNNQT